MKNRCVRFGSSLLLSAMIAVGPAAQAADQGVIYLAKAIGGDVEAPPTKPKPQAVPKQPAKPSVPAKTTPAAPQPPVAAAKPATPPGQPPTGMATSTKVWIGVGVAALLAAVGGAAGGGGGGGGATPAPHP